MLGENIKKYRKENNMSQDDLAEKLNVTRQSVSLWENDQTQPSLDSIIAMAKLFNVSTDVLMTGQAIGGASASNPNPPREENPKKNKKKITVIVAAVLGALLLAGAALLVAHLLKKDPASPDESATSEISENSETISEAYESSAEISESSEESEPSSEPEPSEAESSEEENSSSSEASKTEPESRSDPEESAVSEPSEKSEVKEPKDIYSLIKEFVIKNGKLNGDHSYYNHTADVYGGDYDDDFCLYYWGDTDTVEFSIHRVLDDTYSINYIIHVPKTNNGKYEYVSSYYYRSDGYPVYEAKGTINASEFTTNYPLQCSKYEGDISVQDEFMEMSRLGICEVIKCMKVFMQKEDTGCDFDDFGFKHF